jgi:hypothetical protein
VRSLRRSVNFEKDFEKRYECFHQSALNLVKKITLKETIAHARIMYKDTYELNLNDKEIASDEYQSTFNRLAQEVDKVFVIPE